MRPLTADTNKGVGGRPSPGPVARLLLVLLTGYRATRSPLLGPRCRFLPTCSAYASEAIAGHGAARGGWLAVRRVLRCHPLHRGGYDPVPRRGHSVAAARAGVQVHPVAGDHQAPAPSAPSEESRFPC